MRRRRRRQQRNRKLVPTVAKKATTEELAERKSQMKKQTEMFDNTTDQPSQDPQEVLSAQIKSETSKKSSRKPKRALSVKTQESSRKFWGLRNAKTRRLLRNFESAGVSVTAIFDKREDARHWRDWLNEATRKTFILAEFE